MLTNKDSHQRLPKDKKRARTVSVSHNSNSFNLYNLLHQELGLNQISDASSHKPLSAHNSHELLSHLVHYITVPVHLEKFMCFGLLHCLNSFLQVFTILPLKLVICAVRSAIILRNQFVPTSRHNVKNHLHYIYEPILKCSLIILTLYLMIDVDTSKLYHDIRRQSAIKLYVMIGVLEVVDKLLATLGQDLMKFLLNLQFADVLDKYFALKFVLAYIFCLAYLTAHSTCLVYQTISMNVAVNSYSNALFTLLLSSQFSEMKSSVFKKFDREGLFQNCCADLTERFQVLVYLLLIALRNLVELDTNAGMIPKSWANSFTPSLQWIGIIVNPTIIVIGSELLVDWLKHSYITKYNKIKPKIYERFINVLSNDFLEIHHLETSHNSIEEVNYKTINTNRNLSIRTGLPVLALNVVVMKISGPSIQYLFSNNSTLNTIILQVLLFMILLIVKLFLSLALLSWSTRRKNRFLLSLKKLESEQRKKESMLDPVNPFEDIIQSPEIITPSTPAKHWPLEESSRLLSVNDVVNLDYTPGNLSIVGVASLNQDDMNFLYDDPAATTSIDQKRIKHDTKKILNKHTNPLNEGGLDNVTRYKMSSKQIW